MSAEVAAAQEIRLYGNWRRARGFGIGALGAGQTLIVFGAVLAPILAAYVSPRAALLLGLIGVVVMLVVVRVGGSTVAEIIVRRGRFAHAKSRGYAELSGGGAHRASPQGGSARADGSDGAPGHR